MTLTLDAEEQFSHMLFSIDEEVLHGWNKRFITDLKERYEEEGSDIFVSQKMWTQLERIYTDFA